MIDEKCINLGAVFINNLFIEFDLMALLQC